MQKAKIVNFIKSLGVFGAAVLLVVFPRESSKAAGDAVTLCLTQVIPSMFPFFVLAPMLRLPEGPFRFLMEKAFKVNAGCAGAYIIGLVSGYPVGAGAVASLYREGLCSRDEAERMLAFCCNCGPSFIFGMLAVSVLDSTGAAALLYIVHIASSALAGILLGLGHGPSPAAERVSVPERSFTDCVVSAVSSMLNVSAFIIFFAVYTALLPLRSPLAVGIVEITSGLSRMSGLTPLVMTASAFLLGWGGLSIHCQVLSLTAKSGLSLRRYFTGRIMQGLLSALAVFIICKILWK